MDRARPREPSAVANALLDGLAQSTPGRSFEPDVQHAWETTVLLVLQSWVLLRSTIGGDGLRDDNAKASTLFSGRTFPTVSFHF
jgi:hypothetical protein